MRRIQDRKRSLEDLGRETVARRQYHSALQSGRIERKPCERCGAARAEGHHPDLIGKPLEVVWLCKPCHSKEHGKLRVGKDTVMVAVRVPADELAELRSLTDDEHNMSDLFRQAIYEYLRDVGGKTGLEMPDPIGKSEYHRKQAGKDV